LANGLTASASDPKLEFSRIPPREKDLNDANRASEISDHCQRLLCLDNDSLYVLISDADKDPGRGIRNQSDDDLKQRGRVRFRLELKQLRELLCHNEAFLRARKDPSVNRRVAIVCLIADLIVDRYGLLPGCSLSVLIAREMLDTLCRE
jgi:hypothetical protein